MKATEMNMTFTPQKTIYSLASFLMLSFLLAGCALMQLREDVKGNIQGSVRTTIDGKTSRSSVSLKNEGGFYVDKRTGQRVQKAVAAPESIVSTGI